MKGILLAAALFSSSVMAATAGDYLVKVDNPSTLIALQTRLPAGTVVEDLGLAGWTRVKLPSNQVTAFNTKSILNMPGVVGMEKNGTIRLLENFKVTDKKVRAALIEKMQNQTQGGLGDTPPPDNPAIAMNGSGGNGADTLFSKQWGMNQIGVKDGWNKTKGNPEVVVAVIDTGVDYNHEDLVDNMWRNPGEMGTDAQGRNKSTNGVDDDGNGFVDDIVGWDFVSNDNKPYDLTASVMEMLMGGGNPGHGTHCAGNVAARGDNGKGIAGVAPNVKIMALRFISEKGQGTTADAIKSLNYAMKMGVKVTSNSWGSEGDGGAEDAEAKALKEAIAELQKNGVLFIGAAGNGHQGKGYDNDTDAKPAYPASYDHENIISVAAIAEDGNLGSFSNWGARTVDIGAPGVKVFSTITMSEKYSDTVIDIPGLITATWDGTSMATPHVAGAAALYWSANPTASWSQVKSALLTSVKKTSVLNGKTTSGGALDVQALMR